MSRSFGKFIAVILAIWLPLFSGNALAVSVAMQAMGSDSHSAQHGEPLAHCDAGAQHIQHATDQDQSLDHQDQCCACHLACSGYLAAASLEVMEAQPSVLLYLPVSTRFHSISFILLDPPPIA